MKFNGIEIPREVLAKAMTCDTPEDLVKLAKEYNVNITVEEAAVYLNELDSLDLTEEQLKATAGGLPCTKFTIYCPVAHPK